MRGITIERKLFGVDSQNQELEGFLTRIIEAKNSEKALAEVTAALQLVNRDYSKAEPKISALELSLVLSALQPFLADEGQLYGRLKHIDDLTDTEIKLLELAGQAADDLAFFCYKIANGHLIPVENAQKVLAIGKQFLHLEFEWGTRFDQELMVFKGLSNGAMVTRMEALLATDPDRKKSLLTGQVEMMKTTYSRAKLKRLSATLDISDRDVVSLNYLGNVLNSLSVLYLDLAEMSDDPEVIKNNINHAKEVLATALDHLGWLKDKEDVLGEEFTIREMAVQSNYSYAFILDLYTQLIYGRVNADRLVSALKSELSDNFIPFLRSLKQHATSENISDTFQIEALIRTAWLVSVFLIALEGGDTLGPDYRKAQSQLLSAVSVYLEDQKISLELGQNPPNLLAQRPQLIAIIQGLYDKAVQIKATRPASLDTEDTLVIRNIENKFGSAKHQWLTVTPADGT